MGVELAEQVRRAAPRGADDDEVGAHVHAPSIQPRRRRAPFGPTARLSVNAGRAQGVGGPGHHIREYASRPPESSRMLAPDGGPGGIEGAPGRPRRVRVRTPDPDDVPASPSRARAAGPTATATSRAKGKSVAAGEARPTRQAARLI